MKGNSRVPGSVLGFRIFLTLESAWVGYSAGSGRQAFRPTLPHRLTAALRAPLLGLCMQAADGGAVSGQGTA